MKTCTEKNGFTLTEMVLVVAIIALLVTVLIGIAKRLHDQAKERLCLETITLIGNALEQFRDFGYDYKDPNFTGIDFPLDCNDFTVAGLENIFRGALYFPLVTTVTISGAHDVEFSGSEALFFILSQVPECRKTLARIDKSLLTNTGTDGNPIQVTVITPGTPVTGTTYPLMRIEDPWKKSLRYDYYPDWADYVDDYGNNWPQYLVHRNSAKRTFPVITSAGPDGEFDTFDDISGP